VPTIHGEDLRLGDVVRVWWGCKRDTVTGFREYTGTYRFESPWKGAQIVEFAALPVVGMTVLANDRFEVLSRGAVS